MNSVNLSHFSNMPSRFQGTSKNGNTLKFGASSDENSVSFFSGLTPAEQYHDPLTTLARWLKEIETKNVNALVKNRVNDRTLILQLEEKEFKFTVFEEPEAQLKAYSLSATKPRFFPQEIMYVVSSENDYTITINTPLYAVVTPNNLQLKQALENFFQKLSEKVLPFKE